MTNISSDTTSSWLPLWRVSLRGPVIVDIRLEDSINAKAMDSLEDTIVSDGMVFDDYSEDVLMILKG